MTRDEQKIINAFRHWIDTNTEKGVTTIPEYLCEKVYSMKTQALSQEPNRDIKEIAEVIKSDIDAEIKCRMINNIINSEPHYFKSQQPCEDCEVGNPCLYCEYEFKDKRIEQMCKDCTHVGVYGTNSMKCTLRDEIVFNDGRCNSFEPKESE